MDPDFRPRLRPVEPLPVEVDGRERIALRDPEELAEGTILVEPGALGILALFDGTLSLRGMQELLLRHGRGVVPLEALASLAEALDEACLLEGGRAEEARAARERAFADAPLRAAAHAGAAYPEGAEEARAFLDAMLPRDPLPAPSGLRRLIAPHIDPRLGAEVYGSAHGALRAAGRPDVVVVLGVSHLPLPERFVACRKDFATPFGPVRHAAPFLDRLERRLGRDLARGQAAHRGEHSVEFQALWLAHLWPGDPPAMVPILVASFHDFIETGAAPSDDASVAGFVGALRATIDEEPGRTVVIASVDLAHEGPRYGHEAGLDEAGERRMEAEDARILERTAAGDAEGFLAEVARDGNARNVCGVAPIWVTLALGGGEGRLLRYGQGRIDPGSVVSFAAVAFDR